MLFEKVGGAVEQPGAGFATKRIPVLLCGMAGTNHPSDFLSARFKDGPDFDSAVMR